MSQLITAVLANKDARSQEQVSQLAYTTAVNTPPWSG